MNGVLDITVAIPGIPPRSWMLARALTSVANQMASPAAISVAIDVNREGAPFTRDRALAAVNTGWVAFLDDDDLLFPQHLSACMMHAEATGADLVYPWFDVLHGTDPFPQFFGTPWDNDHPHQVPVTFLARTDLIRDVGGFSHGFDPGMGSDPGVDIQGNRAGEDYQLILRVVASGARIVHLPQRTWQWDHHGGNTSGLPSRW